jgi:hypothetical protein
MRSQQLFSRFILILIASGIELCAGTLRAQQSNNMAQARTTSHPSFVAEARRISQLTSNSLKLVRLNHVGSPHLLVGNILAAQPIIDPAASHDVSTVSTGVNTFMKTQGMEALAIPSDAQFRELKTMKVGSIWHSLYEITYNDIPLREHTIHVHTGITNGKVVLVRSDVPSSEPNATTASVTALEAETLADAAYIREYPTTTHKVKELASLVYVSLPNPREVRLAYETTISDGFHLWRYTLDALSGQVLEKRDMVDCNFTRENVQGDATAVANTVKNSLEPVEASAYLNPNSNSPASQTLSGRILARVHLTKPTDTLTTVGLPSVTVTVNNVRVVTDSTGTWQSTGTYPVTIGTTLAGPYFIVKRKDNLANASLGTTIQSGSLDILWNDSNSNVAERDAYYAVSKARQHALAIDDSLKEGLTNAGQRLTVYVNESQTCNAFYQPQDISLNFFVAGGGCTNTAEIADVVEHEFGHRINNIRYTIAGAQGGYMADYTLNEAFADLSSNFLRDNSLIGIGFFSGSNTTLRNSSNTNMWPKDISPDAHMSGMILTGAVWDLRKLIGHDTAELLFNECEYLIPDGDGLNDPGSLEDAFDNVLMAILSVDDNDGDLSNGTPHADAILKAFQLHNIGIQNFFSMQVRPIADADGFAAGYPVTAFVSYNGVIGVLDTSSVMVHYSTDGKTYATAKLNSTSNDSTFTGVIPKVSGGSLVRYYISAATNYSDAGAAVYPLYTSQPLAFTVGYTSKYLDNCEQDNGWQLKYSADRATAGLWTRVVPFGTDGNIGQVQQDSDHTSNGTKCYITGNGNAASQSDDPTLDCVTGGAVTLTTNELNLTGLTNPIVRYWYNFSNWEGANSGAPVWTTQYSTNGGSGWHALQTTILATDGWEPYAFRVKDLTSALNGTFMLRFIASDAVAAQQYPMQNAPVGTIVEAGIDDVEILDVAQEDVSQSRDSLMVSVYPNPASSGGELQIGVQPNTPQQIISLTNELGQVIPAQGEYLGGSKTVVVLPQSLTPGIYFIRVVAGQHQSIEKVVIQ